MKTIISIIVIMFAVGCGKSEVETLKYRNKVLSDKLDDEVRHIRILNERMKVDADDEKNRTAEHFEQAKSQKEKYDDAFKTWNERFNSQQEEILKLKEQIKNLKQPK